MALWQQAEFAESQWNQRSEISLSGSVVASTVATATVVLTIGFVSAASSASDVSSAVELTKVLSSSASGESSVAGSAWLSKGLTASTDGASFVDGHLRRSAYLSSVVHAVCDASGNINATRGLASQSDAASGVIASTSVEHLLISTIGTAASLAADVGVLKSIQASASAASLMSWAIQKTAGLLSSVNSALFIAGLETTFRPFAGAIASNSAITASVGSQINIAASLAAASEVAGGLLVRNSAESLAIDVESIDAGLVDSETGAALIMDGGVLLSGLNDSSTLSSAYFWETKTESPTIEDDVFILPEFFDNEVIASAVLLDVLTQACEFVDSSVVLAFLEDAATLPTEWDASSVEPAFFDSNSIQLSEETMTAFNVNLKDIVRGDNRRVERTFTGIPTGYTIEKAWLTVKATPAVADASALLQKIITTVSSADGQITTASSSGGTLAMYFELDRTETILATPFQDYYYDIKVKVSSPQAEVHTLANGTVKFTEQITNAYA